jgi:DNA ligase 1
MRPEVVVEIAYNEIQRSTRHRTSFALRFARITRMRDDKYPGSTHNTRRTWVPLRTAV